MIMYVVYTKYIYGKVTPKVYNLAVTPFSSSLACSRSLVRRILPDGFFGIASRNTTPPVIRLNAETLLSMNCVMLSAVADWPGVSTTYARGRSSLLLVSLANEKNPIKERYQKDGVRKKKNKINTSVART